MDKAVKKIRWIALNGAAGYLAYAGAVQGVEWAANVFKFVSWLVLCLSVMTAFALAPKDSSARRNLKAHEMQRTFPAWVGGTYTAIIALMLASVGWFGYASILVIQEILENVSYSYADETRKEVNA